MKHRIWELDAFRGLCVLGMVAVHLIFDAAVLYRLIPVELPPVFTFVQLWGGVLFLVISGISATLGSRSIRRGLIVLGCGATIFIVTLAMYLLGFAGKGMIIWFGVLQCLGVCMILWAVFKKLPTWLLAVLSVGMIAAGLYLRSVILVDFPWLVWLGFLYPGFVSADYFPLLPHLGFFLLGAVLGRTIYVKKTSLLPNVNEKNPLIRFLTGCGKLSLPIYMLHQPVITGIVWLIAILTQ